MRILAMTLAACAALTAAAFDDEPDELNWDTLGGTLTGFGHFVDYMKNNDEARKSLLNEPAIDAWPDRPESVWVKPEDFRKGALCQWEVGEHQGETVLKTYPGHQGLVSRVAVTVPKSGHYRVLTRYWHQKGNVASFAVSIEDERMAAVADPSLTVVQDVWVWRFDFAEMNRRGNPLPNHRDEPTGWIWEASPTVYLKKGRRAVSVSGLMHDGPFDERRVAAVVLTREPLAAPDAKPQAADRLVRDLWARRPMIGRKAGGLMPVWRKWRRQFMDDLANGRVSGIEGGRMAGTVWFDDMSNLIGTPKQIAEDREAMRKFFADADRTHFTVRLEAEDFAVERGWWPEDSGGSSGSKVLTANYDNSEAVATGEVALPSNGVYNVWVKYYEVGGYLAPWKFFVEDKSGKVLAERGMADNWEYNKQHGGDSWGKFEGVRAKDALRFRAYKNSGSYTYRRFDEVVVTDNLAYVPEGNGVVLAPLDKKNPLTVWRPENPWHGYDRVTGPVKNEGLAPYTVTVRDGEVATVLLLVRNNTKKTREITPAVADRANRTDWRLVALSKVNQWTWVPMQLLRRDRIFAPPEETVGVWLNVKGDAKAASRTVKVKIGDETFSLEVVRREAHPGTVPVPYVFGWSAPYRTLSCWQMYRDLGINVMPDLLIPKAEADRYGVRLTVRLNDGDVSPKHVKDMTDRYARQGYSTKDWAWSFMDEPGNGMSDQWVALAKKLRESTKDVQIWVNPGEIEGAGPESDMKMTPFVNCYCPYYNHYLTNGGGNGAYNAQLHRQGGVNFNVLLSYSTPCFGEKAPSATLHMFELCDLSLRHGWDGWAFFAFAYGFTQSNSLWDEVNNMLPDQVVNIYPGAAYRTISTRNAEALREAVQRWREAKAAQAAKK